MKIGIGLAAALALAILSPSMASAQPKPDKAAQAALDKTRKQGMAEAPAVVQAKGLSCTVADAYYLGDSQDKDEKGKTVTSKVYEVACQEGRGFILGNPSPIPLDCLKLSTVADRDTKDGKKVSVPLCKLPANADPKTSIVPTAKSAGVSCPVDKARWVGESPSTKIDQYEVGCSDGQAFLLNVPQAGSTEKLAAENCLKVTSGGGSCEYFSKASATAAIGALAAKSGRACQISDTRWVATKTAGGEFYEVACADGKSGYMFETDPAGAFQRAIACANAEPIAGGCTLTTLAVAGETSEAPLYNKKAKEIGYACNVNKYRSLGLDNGGLELAELACSDRPDGAFATLPVNPGQKGGTYNCVRAEARGQACKLSPKSAVFTKLTNQMENKGKKCEVADTRGVGQTPTGEDVVEIKCSAGPGFMVVFFKDSDGMAQVLDCSAAANLGGGCKLK